MRLGHQAHRVDVVDRLEAAAEPEPVEHLQRIGRVAVGEDQLAPRQPRDRGDQRRVVLQHVHLDIVDIVEESCGSTSCSAISPASVVPWPRK